MALTTYKLSSRHCFLLRVLYSTTRDIYYCIPNKVDNEINPLDTFTTQLMQEKLVKWNKYASKNNDINIHFNKIKNLITPNNSELQCEYQQEVKTDQYVALIKDDLKNEFFPGNKIISIVKLCAQKGDKSQIIQIQTLCKEKHSKFLETHSHFKHYIAEAIWMGGNITESFTLFEEVYASNPTLRKKIRLILKNLIESTIHNRSEAVLINLTSFAKEFSTKYNDFFFLSCIWQVCIQSEWFSDQNYALDLFENDLGLRETVISKLQYIVVISLYNHKIDLVYKIFEILLKNDMKDLYSGVLLALLNYQSKYNYLYYRYNQVFE